MTKETTFDSTTFDPFELVRKMSTGFDLNGVRDKFIGDVWQSQQQAVKGVQTIVESVAATVPADFRPFAANLQKAALNNVNFLGTLVARQTELAVELVKAFGPEASAAS
jgi:hypothetical protein